MEDGDTKNAFAALSYRTQTGQRLERSSSCAGNAARLSRGLGSLLVQSGNLAQRLFRMFNYSLKKSQSGQPVNTAGNRSWLRKISEVLFFFNRGIV